MSYQVEVQADSTGTWAGNSLRFASQDEADDYGRDLAFRWTAVRHWRSVESDEPVTHVRAGGVTREVANLWPVGEAEGD
jgi:hypothetical protein